MIQVLTDAQIQSLVNAPDARTRLGCRDRALLSIMAFGGLRIQEVCHLRRNEITSQGGTTRLTFAGKGGKTRTVTLPPQAVSALEKHLMGNTSPFVFPGRYGPLQPRAGRNIVTHWAGVAGLPEWVHPHSLRHSYGTKLMRETGDLFLVARVLGHSHVQTTAKYYLCFDPSYADRAAKVWG